MKAEIWNTMTVRLIQFTDPHLYGDADETLRGVATLPSLRRALDHADLGPEDVEAVLVTGDLVQDDPRGYSNFRRVFDSFGRPVLCIPGNHDDIPAMRAALNVEPYQICGHRDLGAWRIVLLDSAIENCASGRLSQAALEQLDRALAEAPTRHALVCLHHHPVPLGSRWLDAVALENPDEFFAVLDRHPNVRAVTWGHVHQTFDGYRRGVRLLATPATCAQFLPHSDEFAIDSKPPGYRWITLHDDGTLDTRLVWVTP